MLYKTDDVVVFHVGNESYTYKVSSDHLYNIWGENAAIFNALGILDYAKYCEEAYGYKPHIGYFPRWNKDDTEAATKIILKLLKNCIDVNNQTVRHYKKGDAVTFCVGEATYLYTVYSDCVTNNQICGYNDQIFRVLQLDKNAFCEKYYGYKADIGDWPACIPNDYCALTRVINALHDECDKYNHKQQIKKWRNELPFGIEDAIEPKKSTPEPSPYLNEIILLTPKKKNTCKF